jgi:hypothetical protein
MTLPPPETAQALADKMFAGLPAGYVLQPDNVGDTGPSDLEKAVRDDGDDDARQALTDAGFIAGFQKLWVQGDNEIVGFLYRFRDPLGAQLYFKRTVQGLASDPPKNVHPINVPGVPGVVGFGGSDTDGVASVVAFARGPYTAQLIVDGPLTGPPDEAIIVGLAQEQFNKLNG